MTNDERNPNDPSSVASGETTSATRCCWGGWTKFEKHGPTSGFEFRASSSGFVILSTFDISH